MLGGGLRKRVLDSGRVNKINIRDKCYKISIYEAWV